MFTPLPCYCHSIDLLRVPSSESKDYFEIAPYSMPCLWPAFRSRLRGQSFLDRRTAELNTGSCSKSLSSMSAELRPVLASRRYLAPHCSFWRRTARLPLDYRKVSCCRPYLPAIARISIKSDSFFFSPSLLKTPGRPNTLWERPEILSGVCSDKAGTLQTTTSLLSTYLTHRS
jgi:hypothetical protein